MTTHATALAQTQARGLLYLEIEGLPYAFGTEAKDGAWFDVPGQSFLGIKPWLRAGADADLLPRISAQRVDFINSRVSIGALRIGVADMDGSLAAWTGGWRRDDFLRMASPSTPSFSIRTDPSIAGTASVVKLRSGDAKKIAVGSRVVVDGSPGVPRRVVDVDLGNDEITVSPPLDTAPDVDRSVLTDRVPARADVTAFRAEGDRSEGGTTAAWAGETMAFVGMETMAFAPLSPGASLINFGGVTRGAYRSRIGEHVSALFPSDGEQSMRGLLTKYPRQMRGRRVWLKWGLDATADSETNTVFAGTIDSLSWTDLGRTLVIECEDAQSWLRQPLFTDLGSRIPAGSTASESGAFLIASDPDGRALTLAGGAIAATGRAVYALRDAVGGGIAGVGDLFHPVTLVAGATGSVVNAPLSQAIVTAYDGVAISEGAIPYSHPLEIALAIMTSTGAGTNGAYDVLPAEWGLSIPESDINVGEILTLVAEPDTPVCRVVITEPVREARAWLIETLLKPFGYYLTVGVEHPITIAALRAPTPDEAQGATPIGINDIVIEPGGRILIEGPTMENTAILGAIALSYHPTLVDGKVEFARERRIPVTNANDAAAWQSAPDVEIQAWLGDRSIPGGLADDADVITHFENLGKNMLARFSAPPSILRVTCQMGLVGVAPGELVSVTLPHLPNASRAARGMTGELFEVWSREVDLARGVVVLELAQTNIVVERTRYLAPACAITGVDGTYATTKTVTVEQNDYTPGDGVDDTDAFEVGDAVRLYSADLATRSDATTIASKTATSVTLAAAVQIGGADPASGCHLQLADYGEVGATAKQKWAFRAAADGLLGGVDAPHVHA